MQKRAMIFVSLIGFTGSALALGPQAAAPQPAPQPKIKIVHTAHAAGAEPAIAAVYGDPGSSSYLGVDIQEITPERMSALKLKEERGVEVVMVDQDAPAAKAGLKERDVILDFNGTRVEGSQQLGRMIHEVPPGRTVTLGISRDGQYVTLKATLGNHKDLAKTFSYSGTPNPHAFPQMPDMPQMPEIDIPAFDVVVRSYSASTGMLVDNLTPQLGTYFGVKSGEGVLVRSVEKGSAAEAAGIKAGDVIVKVEDEKITDRNDWRRALRNRKAGKVNITLVRDKREQTLPLTIAPPRGGDSSRLQFEDEDFDMDTDFDGDFDVSSLNHHVHAAMQKYLCLGSISS